MEKEPKYNDADYEKTMHAFSDENGNDLNMDINNPEYKQCAKIWNILEEMKEIENFDTDKAWDKLHNRFVEDDLVNNGVAKVISLNRIIAVAASILILLGILFISKQTDFNNIILVENNTQNPKVVVLPDGSEVNLNNKASIKYPKEFDANTREVEFTGEAFFNIARNTQKPFIVNVNKAQIKVLGTSFNVLENLNNTLEVIVKTGKVQLCDCSNTGNNVTLVKGEKGMITSKVLVKMQNDNENYLAWINKKIVFKSTPLSIVVRDINAAYHANVMIKDNELSSMKITTTFDSLSIEEVLQSISLTLDIGIEQQKENTILVKH